MIRKTWDRFLMMDICLLAKKKKKKLLLLILLLQLQLLFQLRLTKEKKKISSRKRGSRSSGLVKFLLEKREEQIVCRRRPWVPASPNRAFREKFQPLGKSKVSIARKSIAFSNNNSVV